MTAVSSLVVALSISVKLKTSAWALVTPIARRSVGSRVFQLQEGSLTSRLEMASRKTKTLILPDEQSVEAEYKEIDLSVSDRPTPVDDNKDALTVLVASTSSTIIGLVALSEAATAISVPTITMPKELTQSFDPSSFTPVCAASDSFYRVLQGTAQTIVGKENFVEYGPLIASGLLRVRLELCVVESFFNEAVGPFINQNGLSWVLPLHETVETFLAGTVFALATTFILVGSTKLLTVIFT